MSTHREKTSLGVVYSGGRLLTVDLSNALYPVVQCLPILVRFLDTVHGLQGGDPGGALHQLTGAGLTSLAYI